MERGALLYGGRDAIARCNPACGKETSARAQDSGLVLAAIRAIGPVVTLKIFYSACVIDWQ